MATPHNRAKDNEIASIVLMPGDPLRAKFIADTFLEDVVMFNDVRGMYGFTGTYKSKRISVMGSGMGMPSIGIYSYELYKFYNVDTIIRIGSCGAYTADLNLFDTILTTGVYSKSTYAKEAFGYSEEVQLPSSVTNQKLRAAAERVGVKLVEGIIHSSDVFYNESGLDIRELHKNEGCLAAEMESFALFANARYLGKNAACLLTVSDSLITHEETTAQQRQESFTNMMEVALNILFVE